MAHTFASRLVQRGQNLKVIQELLGHATIDMVLLCAHLSDQHLRDAVVILDEGENIEQVKEEAGILKANGKVA